MKDYDENNDNKISMDEVRRSSLLFRTLQKYLKHNQIWWFTETFVCFLSSSQRRLQASSTLNIYPRRRRALCTRLLCFILSKFWSRLRFQAPYSPHYWFSQIVISHICNSCSLLLLFRMCWHDSKLKINIHLAFHFKKQIVRFLVNYRDASNIFTLPSEARVLWWTLFGFKRLENRHRTQ